MLVMRKSSVQFNSLIDVTQVAQRYVTIVAHTWRRVSVQLEKVASSARFIGSAYLFHIMEYFPSDLRLTNTFIFKLTRIYIEKIIQRHVNKDDKMDVLFNSI